MILLIHHTSILSVIHMPSIFSSLVILGVLTCFIALVVWNTLIARRFRMHKDRTNQITGMIQQALTITSNNVVRYVPRDNFIYNLYGSFLPDNGQTVEIWKSHIHPDDFDNTLEQFHRIIDGTQQQAEFYYRWNMNFGPGEPRWGYMHNVSIAEYNMSNNTLVSIISTLWDEADILAQEQEEKELTSKYKQIFENSIVGLSFYTPDGWLLDTNKIMREICHFDSPEGDEFFSKNNMFDMPPFSECCDRNNIEELWICSQSIVPERNIHDYLEIHMHPIRNNEGQVVFLAIAVRNISEEREMYLQAKLNDIEIIKANEKIQNYEEELRYMMDGCEIQPWRITFARNCIEYYNGLSTIAYSCSLEEMRKQFVDQDDEYVKRLDNPHEYFAEPISWIGQVHPIFSHGDKNIWVQINSIPEYDENGKLKGCFGIWRNMSNLMLKQELLKRETERANDSGRLKSVFLANMTHEIRTPLNAIVGFSDLLQMIDGPEEKREMIRVIHNNCDMLLRLINDILVLSNVESNAMQIIAKEVDFAAEFDNACVSLAQRVQEPTVEFIKDNPYESLHLIADFGRIQQVITNFVTNAVKYTHEGHILVGYKLEERQKRQGIYVYCEDTGSGIPEDQCDRIFERFVKLNDFIQGTGLGLSICKIIIEKCEGQIGVNSEVGKGSTFWFWVPAEKV